MSLFLQDFTMRAAVVGLLCAGPFVLAGCTSSVGSPACNALVACCESPNDDDPSSCSESAMSGEETNAECAATLATLQADGTCPADGGVVAPDAGDAH